MYLSSNLLQRLTRELTNLTNVNSLIYLWTLSYLCM